MSGTAWDSLTFVYFPVSFAVISQLQQAVPRIMALATFWANQEPAPRAPAAAKTLRDRKTCATTTGNQVHSRQLGFAGRLATLRHQAHQLGALFHRNSRTLLTTIALQDFLPQSQVFRSYFHKLILRNELNRLLEI
jgi:hypothetical protein